MLSRGSDGVPVAPHHAATPYLSEAVQQRLSKHAGRLFVEEPKAALYSLDLGDGAEGVQPYHPSSCSPLLTLIAARLLARADRQSGLPQETPGRFPMPVRKNLSMYLPVGISLTASDVPISDGPYSFITAAHSRAKLNISREMFDLYSAALQFMPEYIDFILSFGERHIANDFYSPGFRQRTYLTSPQYVSGNLPGVVGTKRFQICYTLKSVEPSHMDGWSIRQCAIHHTFDLTTGQTAWTVVKGNDLIQKRIKSAAGEGGSLQAVNFHTVDRAFEASLRTHLLCCDWSIEHWRWYLNSLEDKFGKIAGTAFSAPINADYFRKMSRTNTQVTAKSKQSIFDKILTPTSNKDSIPSASNYHPQASSTHANPGAGYVQPQPPPEDDDDDGDRPGLDATNPDDETRDFSFGRLRNVYGIARNVNEALLVLKQNIVVLAQLKAYYGRISRHKKFPAEVASSCGDAIEDFQSWVEGIGNDMQIQVLRLETLLNLIEDRRTLVHTPHSNDCRSQSADSKLASQHP